MFKDDLAARREARKRRILENAEKRLSKIIISCDKSKYIAEPEPNVQPWDKDWTNFNGLIPSSEVVEAKVDQPSQPEPIQHVHPLEEEEESSEEIVSQEEEFDEKLLIKDILSETNSAEDKAEGILWIDFLFIIVLSFLVRLMYEFNLSYMFGESLLIPFLTITTAKAAADPRKRNSKLPMYGSIIKASLLLSGVPSTWLDKVFFCFQVAVDLGSDFALYLFSFTVSHLFLESFAAR